MSASVRLCDCTREKEFAELVVVFPFMGLALHNGSEIGLGAWNGPLPRSGDVISMGDYVFDVLTVEFVIPEPGTVPTLPGAPAQGGVVFHGGWRTKAGPHVALIDLPEDDGPPPGSSMQ